MKRTQHRRTLIAATTATTIVLLVATFVVPPAHGDSVFSAAATHWECYYRGTRPHWDEMCGGWRRRMATFGYSDSHANNSAVRLLRFTDPALQPWGADNDYADASFASIICTHGRHPNATAGWRGTMYKPEHEQCFLEKKDRKFGRASGGKLRFLHLSSCNSIPWPFRATWDSAATGGVHVIAGFHGSMYIGADLVDDYRAMATEGHYDPGVATTWINKMYKLVTWGHGGYSQCPVARAYGNDSERAAQVLDERYDDNLTDTSPQVAVNLYIGGCDPADHHALPN